MKRFSCLGILLIICIPATLFGQVTLTGNLVESVSRKPVPYALIIAGKNLSTTSDSTGKFQLQTDPGQLTLTVKSVGYRELTAFIFLKSDTSIILQLQTLAIEKGPVVVSASRMEQQLSDVPVSMEVLKPAFIEHTNQTSMQTAVEQVSGVTVIDGQANIRGGSGYSYGAGTRVLVLVDDLPMLAGDANDVKWSFMPIETVEQVEVLKGASSALYGSSALNGVINMRTKFASEIPQTHFTIYSGLFDSPDDESKKWWNGTRGSAGVNFSHARKFKNLDIVAGGHYFNDAGYRKEEVEERVRGNINLRYHFNSTPGLTAGLAVNAQRAEGGLFLIWENDTTGALIPAGSSTNNTTLSEYTTTRVTVDPSLSFSRGKFSHKLRGRYFLTDNVNNTDQESKAQVYFSEYLFRYTFSEAFKTTAGITATFNEVNGDLYGKQKSNTLGAYVQLDGKKGRFTWSAGYRAEKAEISGDALDAEQLVRAGVNFRVLKATWLRTSFGQGFRFPSIAEKFIRTNVGNIVIYPNDSLITERGFSFEAGIRQGMKFGNWTGMIDAAYFITEYEDMMEFTFGAYGNPAIDPLFGLGFKSKNVGNTRITGYELMLTGDGEIGKLRETITTGVTVIDPVSLDFDPAVDTIVNSSTENVLKYRYTTLFKFDSETGYRKFFIGVTARYYSYMENIDKLFEVAIPGVKNYRETHTDGDWILDLRAGYAISSHTTFTFIVKNFTNEEWMTRPADLQPPRSFIIQASIKL